MRKKRVQATYTVVDRFRRKRKITFRGTIEYVPLPEELKERTYREWMRLYLRAFERKNQEEKGRTGEG
jgi:hypothetical protein